MRLTSLRRLFARRRCSTAPRCGRVGRAWPPDAERVAQRCDQPFEASSRFRSWLRSSSATARMIGPARVEHALLLRSVRDGEASTSKSASTRVSDFWAC